MSKTLQFRRYITANVLANTASAGELFVDTTQNTISVGDGTTPGGWYLATQYQLNANVTYLSGVNTTQNTNISLLQAGLNTANANTVYLAGALNSANTIKANNSGYLANLVIFSNTTGYLSNTNSLQYFTSNNNLVLTGNVIAGNLTTTGVANVGTLIVTGSETDSGTLTINSTTAATSNTIGALVVKGGSAVTGNVFAGGYVYSSNGIGYPTGTGAGGIVTQGSSRTTGVTLNALSGTITLFNTTLAAQTTQAFVVTNSFVAATDMVLVQHQSGGTLGQYVFGVTPAAGSVTISVRSTLATTSTASEAPVLQFMVFKATTT